MDKLEEIISSQRYGYWNPKINEDIVYVYELLDEFENVNPNPAILDYCKKHYGISTYPDIKKRISQVFAGTQPRAIFLTTASGLDTYYPEFKKDAKRYKIPPHKMFLADMGEKGVIIAVNEDYEDLKEFTSRIK